METSPHLKALSQYRKFLERGHLDACISDQYLSRYHTFSLALNFLKVFKSRPTIIELGTSRSFVDGMYPGCNESDSQWWEPENPEKWDWGAGLFSHVAAAELEDRLPIIHTVDISEEHIRRSKIINERWKHLINFHVSDSVQFLKTFEGKADLIYLDTGDMTPIGEACELQLAEAQIVVARADAILKPCSLILIDDVRNKAAPAQGYPPLGKSCWAIPHLLEAGFRIVMDEYQTLLMRSHW